TMVTEQFQQLIDEGLGGKDCSLIVKYATPDGSPRGYTP
ncbi:3-hydroxyisobutyrate dehydrogenase, partial [Mycobacteroides abscessus]